MKLIKNTKLYTPESIGEKDILIGAEKILLIEDKIDLNLPGLEVIDAQDGDNLKQLFADFLKSHGKADLVP